MVFNSLNANVVISSHVLRNGVRINVSVILGMQHDCRCKRENVVDCLKKHFSVTRANESHVRKSEFFHGIYDL